MLSVLLSLFALYGCGGGDGGAASTTATGRKMVTLARDYTLDKFKGSKLVYGDTDSIFVSFVDYIKEKYKNKKNITEKEMLKYTIEVGEEAGEYVTSKLKKPQNLEYEKVFWPSLVDWIAILV